MASMRGMRTSGNPRDPAALLERTLFEWGGRADVWIFGYASLIWRPAFHADEERAAVVHGWHRALRMHSRINRGTPEQPGLVFALMAGGSCRGFVYRISREHAAQELQRLWLREMPSGVYDPKWLACRTPHGPVHALGFTLHRQSPNHTGRIDDERLLRILRVARGRYGTTLDYLVETGRALRAHGIVDAEVDRMIALARRHGLAP